MSHSHVNPAVGVLVNRDEEHVRLLSGYHWLAVILHGFELLVFVVLPLCIGPSFYAAMGTPAPPPTVLQQLLLVNLLLRGTLTLLIAFNAWLLQRRRNWVSCLILSILECSALVLMRDPLSLILGVSTVLVLRRDSAKALFRKADANVDGRSVQSAG
jgi:hypothetical protein